MEDLGWLMPYILDELLHYLFSTPTAIHRKFTEFIPATLERDHVKNQGRFLNVFVNKMYLRH